MFGLGPHRLKQGSVRRTLMVLAIVAATVCSAAAAAAPAKQRIILATTTSAQDSGLLQVLIPIFTSKTGIEVDVIAVGTGQAIATAKRGDADVLLVHSRVDEEKFMAEGYGREHWCLMYNDFIIVGPKSDPSGVRGANTLDDAMKRIATGKAPFVSRGDQSGTHVREQQVWQAAGIDPKTLTANKWYVEAGAGMADVLRMAYEMSAYTLTDRATYLAQSANVHLEIVREGDPVLLNPYSVITLNKEKLPAVKYELGREFAQFLIAPDTQALIGRFGVEKYGRPLFVPIAGKCKEAIGCTWCNWK